MDQIYHKLAPALEGFTPHQDEMSPNRDVRHHDRIRASSVQFYAQVLPLTQEQVQNANDAESSIDWSTDRAWFDERVKAARLYDLDNGRWWTGALFGPGYHKGPKEPTDSYFEADYEDWIRQKERDKALTLSTSAEGEGCVDSAIKHLDELVLVE
jgi:hypothetical protein